MRRLLQTSIPEWALLFYKMETKTHWKKNLDPRYISGDDLKAGLNGLAPEMVVTISAGKDAPTFDQTKQAEVSKTALWLKDLSGKNIYKPVILNVTNAKSLSKEFGSDFIEDWYNKPVVLYACPDRRFGHVARFKKYYPPVQVKADNALSELSKCSNLIELSDVWTKLTTAEKQLPTVISKKDELKSKLS